MEMPRFRIPEYQQKEFTNYYKQRIFPKCKKLEKRRSGVYERMLQRQRKGLIFHYFGAILMASPILSIPFLASSNSGDTDPFHIVGGMLVVIIGFFIFGTSGVWMYGEKADFTNEAHNVLFPIVLKFFGKDFKLNPHKVAVIENNLKKLKDYGIFPNHTYKIIGDHLKGRWKGTNFDFYELELRKPKGEKQTESVFKGVFITIEMRKRFTGTVCVVQDKGWMQSTTHKGLSRVKLEDPRFEKIFEVYGSDQVEARYLITPKMMETLSALRRRFGIQTEVCFKNKLMIIKIPTQRRFFSASLPMENPINYKSTIESLFADMEYIFTLAELLKQNDTRL